MNIKNKILIALIMLLKLNAGLIFTAEEKAFAEVCKNFMEFVLKPREVAEGMVTAFTAQIEIPNYPFELTDNPNIESIRTICKTIDTICVAGVKPALLVLGGFMYKIFSRLCPQDEAHHLARSFKLYELATSEANINTIHYMFEDAQNLCRILKSGRPLTEREEGDYIDITGRISGFMSLNQYITRLKSRRPISMEMDGSSRRSPALLTSSLTKLLAQPLDWSSHDPEEAVLVCIVLNISGLSPFVAFVNALTNNHEPALDVSLAGACMSLMYACKALHERDLDRA